jgi:hypothetical protein
MLCPAAPPTASHNASCANLSDCGNEASVLDGLETFDVGEYHLVSCPICLEHFTLDNPAILLKCEHGFHLQCLESWRQRSSMCPMCFTPIAGDEGRLMSPANARRRRRLRVKASSATTDSPRRRLLIDATSGAVCSGAACEHSDCDAPHLSEQGGETEVIEVTSADQDPHSWCGWLRQCCCFLS